MYLIEAGSGTRAMHVCSYLVLDGIFYYFMGVFLKQVIPNFK